MRIHLPSVTLLLLLATPICRAQTGWTPEEMIKFRRVGSTRMSPDGSRVAYTISVPQTEGEKSEYLTHIWVAATDGSMNLQFTQGEKSCMNPVFSPDGAFLAFLSARGSEGKSQIWIMPVNGGEAEQITHSKSGVEQYAWSPDGKRFAFLQRDGESDNDEKIKKEKRDWTLVDHWKYSHLYTIALERAGKSERNVKRITAGEFHVTGFDWSPDGKSIVFAHQLNPSVDSWPTSDISIVPSDSGSVKRLVSMNGLDGSPAYSPDGQQIAFVSDGGQPKWAGMTDIYVIPAAGGSARKIIETPDREPVLYRWSSDGKEIYFTENDHTTNRLFVVTITGGKPRALTPGDGNFTGPSLSRDGKTLCYVHQTPEISPEVFVTGVAKWEPKKLSNANPGFPRFPLGKTELIKWKSTDGKEIEGLLTYPVNYKPGKPCPLILNIHGGPAGLFVQNFTAAGATYPIQAFAQQGYAILRPNPRGSGGYGKDFRHANYKDWGFGDYNDDISGVDKVIAMGVAHADSLIICGWSYGGYMTSFAITKTNRFKAACVGAGVTNLMSFVGTADIPSFIPDYFGGEYWDNLETYMKHSAMFNIKNVRTPSLVLHGERDVRVPPSQGFEFYTALRRLGVPTEMVTYPRTPHGLQEPKFIQDAGERMIAWFNKYLRHPPRP